MIMYLETAFKGAVAEHQLYYFFILHLFIDINLKNIFIMYIQIVIFCSIVIVILNRKSCTYCDNTAMITIAEILSQLKQLFVFGIFRPTPLLLNRTSFPI